MKHWPFSVTSGTAGKPSINVIFKGENKTFSAEEISSMVLIKMKEISEAYLGREVKNAVITVLDCVPFLLIFYYFVIKFNAYH